MTEKKWTDRELFNLLLNIDSGYKPTQDEINKLKSKKRLERSTKNVTVVPQAISYLTALEELNLTTAKINELPDSLGKLDKLKRVFLGYTEITTLPQSMACLTSLRELYLHNTNISEFPPIIRDFKALEVLTLGDTKITTLPEWIGELPSLKRLNLSGTMITSLPESIGKLTSLINLEINNSQTMELPDRIGDLPNLKYLDLSGLKLDRIPESLAMKGLPFVNKEFFYDHQTCVNLYGTTLAEQDVSIFLESPSLIPSLYEEKQETLKECKVIFLGDGGAGKSYTIKRMKNGGRKETEENPYVTTVTHGIEISDWEIKGEDKLTVHLWDFGGQDVMHSMHRCFLTEKTCYVVTVDSRRNDGDQRARYWLRNVSAFAPNSPVLLFVNCWEDADGSGVIDETGLRSEYKDMINDVIYCSAKEASYTEFREKIMAVIEKTVRASGFGQQKVARRYYKARRALDVLSKEKKPFLTREEYHELCAKHGIENENALDLLTFFNNTGVCFSYHLDRDRKELEDYRLLQPLWLTNAVYAIIEEGRAYAHEGVLSIEAITRILCGKAPDTVEGRAYRRVDENLEYKEEQIGYILAVAEAYELCYITEREEAFFPALLTRNSPREANEYTGEYPNIAEYRFIYEYLPDSVVHRLMIRFKKNDIAINACWLKGMMLGSMGNHKAIIRIMDEKTLRVEVLSKDVKPASELFPLIRSEIIGVNAALGLSAREAAAEGEDVFTVISLLNTHKEGDDKAFGSVTGKAHSAYNLLNTFYDALSIAGMTVDDMGRVHISPYHYLKLSKDNETLREALYESHNRQCVYCGIPIRYNNMQIDHILAKKHINPKDIETKMYLAQLGERGFNIDDPDYVENYLPCCAACNRKKSNEVFTAANLRYYHELALKHASDIQRRMEMIGREKETKTRQRSQHSK